MNELAFQHQGFGFGPSKPHDMGSPIYASENAENEGPVELQPNPDFVFPARSPDAFTPQLQSWYALNQRPRSQHSPTAAAFPPPQVARRQRPSISALPAFTFNPSASESTSPSMTMTTITTPPHSPGPTTPTSPNTPSRAIGHRRGGSEFIGGDGKTGGIGLMSTSPTKGDGALPPPSTSLRLGPPPGRRGHAHRRSGAISCHDMQSILQPKDANAQQRSGSAPVTPLESGDKSFFPSPSHTRRTLSQTALRPSFEQSEAPVQQDEASPRRPTPRVRVGFADRVEYIRPLSTISSETESSMSTIRGHSTHSSLTSVLSGGPSSPPSVRVASRPTLDTTYEDMDARQRPLSAGNILDTKSKAKEGFHLLPHFGSRPKSEHGIPKDLSEQDLDGLPAKRKSFSWWDHAKTYPARVQTSRVSTIPSSSSEPSLVASSGSPLPSPRFPPSAEDDSAVLTSPTRVPKSPSKPRKEPRKVKSWAHSIISRKPKSYYAKDKLIAARPATPPPTSASEDEPDCEHATDNFEPDFDADNTVTIISTPSPKRPYIGETLRDNRNSFDRESGSASPVIDLDAALGPFNTPPLGANTRGSSRRAPPSRRSMHSLGVNYNNHRRAESAPELPPFENSGLKKASSFMEDVFEEEDEEESGVEKHGATASESRVEASNLSVETGSISNISHVTEVTRQNLLVPGCETQPITMIASTVNDSIQQRPRIITMQSPLPAPANELSFQSSQFLPPSRDVSPVEVVEDYEEPRACLLDKDSDSTLTPTLTPDGPKEPPPLLTLGHAPPTRSIMTPDTISRSAFSTPELGPVQVYEPTRLGTAHSSIIEYRSLSFGEPGPEVRMSVDDVPSLTSSHSTATSPANHAFGRPGSAVFIDQFPRAQSIVSTASFIERTRKRSSIASLSRLVGFERSKLNIESRPQSQHIPPTTSTVKSKKTKRLSRLLNFWRPKNYCAPMRSE